MENFLNENQLILLDQFYKQSPMETLYNDNTKYFYNMNNVKKQQELSGNSSQLAEIGIPLSYFENNNVYNFYDQELQNEHMLQNIEPRSSQNTTRFSLVDNNNQYEWPINEYNNIMVLESLFPSSNFSDIQSTLPVPTAPQYSLFSFGSPQNYNYQVDSRRPHQTFSTLYETDCQSRIINNNPSSSFCNQKPPVYTKWTEEEDELLRTAINIYGPHKWSLIAAHVPNRTPMQCSTRWLGALNPTIHKGRWTPEEDTSLKNAVNEYIDILDSDGHPQPIPWNKIASRIPHRTGIQCQARWSEALDPSVKKGKWSPEEDNLLKEGVRRYGRCWIRIAELINGRTQRQCRTRWVQIRNKQAKIERDAIAIKNGPDDENNNDDNNNNDILTPPQTTPSTPSQPLRNHLPPNNNNTILQGILRPNITISNLNQSPIMSPTETNTTESCVATPENNNILPSPSFNKSNNNNNLYLYNY